MAPARPAPGPVTHVDLREPRAAAVLDAVRRRVATWADPALSIRRASQAAKLARDLVARGAMAVSMGPSGSAVLVLSTLPSDRPLWILGDVRGDVLALATALAFIDEADGRGDRAFVACLGDWTGGNAGDAACTAMLLERFNAAPERTLLLRGDREWDCRVAGVPSAAGLHAMPVPEALTAEHATMVAQVRALADALPALALLPDGVALAHGTIPRETRLSGVTSLDALARNEAALRDCVLGRVHPSEPRVAPGGREGGTLLGAEDFGPCAARLSAVCGRSVTRLVRGQDGVPEGFRWFSAYGEGAVLTLSTMADAIERAGAQTRRRPCVGRLKGGVIRVVRMEIPDDACFLCDQLFPRRKAWHPVTPTATVTPPPATTAVLPTSSGASTGRPAPADTRPIATDAALAQFERGVRLLEASAWGGALDCFEQASQDPVLRSGALLNQAVACLWLGPGRHQDALARLRELAQRDPRDEAARLNLGIAFLSGERNPIEAARALRAATEIRPELADAWWALGLALAMRGDAKGADAAFRTAAEAGGSLPVPSLRAGLLSARELAQAVEALRGVARHRPAPGAPAVALNATHLNAPR